MPDLGAVLGFLRANSTSQKAKGTFFEKLCVAFLRQDPGMQQQFSKVWLYGEWAKQNGLPGTDTGIDIVAEVREGGVCAAQCKFYAAKHSIQKAEIDSFFTASGKHPFTRRVIFDTTEAPWSKNAEAALVDQQIPTSRLGLDRIDEAVDWSRFLSQEKAVAAPKKQPRPHQVEAIADVEKGFGSADRGKLLMACGTGKTFTGLKIAEKLAGSGKWVLFLVPSLSLMSQSIREWTIDSETPLRARAVCSDTEVGRRPGKKDDMAEFEAQDLDTPATTNPARLADSLSADHSDRMTVVFATYQSIQVVSAAQKEHSLPDFDLIICDEAHRTTGVVFPGDDSRDSNFVKVHDQEFLRGRKRLYMTATPRIFGDAVKTKAGEESVELCSMDDSKIYGETLFERGFGWAVENGLLTDYKVVVLAVDEAMVSAGLQVRLADSNNELKLDDATKIIGCYKALTKNDLRADIADDALPMRRGLAFCRDIATSKLVQSQFAATVADFLASDEGQENDGGNASLSCELEHVDGTFMAKERTRLLDWLKESPPEGVCRILTNARCLSEGVDVPALDAILFMHPRKSQIDVVQSVGRVMRRAEGKQMGYVILPVGIPAGVTPEDALNDNERYRVVWQILNALRSHDERLDATINKIDLGEDVSGRIEIVAVSNKLPIQKSEVVKPNIGHGSAPAHDDGQVGTTAPSAIQASFVFDEVSKAIMARIVKKCGKRDYWESWAGDIAKIAQAHITRITTIVQQEGSDERATFLSFLTEIRRNLNDSISEADAIEMLAQHVITRPVFEALFEGQTFVQSNPVSVAMEAVLRELDDHSLDKEATTLTKFYEGVKRRATGTESGAAKQRIINELYEKFFRGAFPRTTSRLGIVYTPVEIVDFILRSMDDVLRDEFGQTLGSAGVHILEPFAGTGTFIVRLLQSGLLTKEQVVAKYGSEIHACELVLLAYYIAAINIEASYHDVIGGEYKPFDGICLMDTFASSSVGQTSMALQHFGANNERAIRQRTLDIRIIVGNPPYSIGQQSDNDDNQNVAYPDLDERIRTTYVARSGNATKRALYDSYVRAIRWASDRIGDRGAIGFVTNAGFLDSTSADGLRKCLANEFSNIYIFNLRGNARTAGEARRKEKDNVFGVASRAPAAISVLVKNPTYVEQGRVRYRDIGDYLSREQKLATISACKSVNEISIGSGWTEIEPDDHGDWLRKRDTDFARFMSIGDEGTGVERGIFDLQSRGVVTSRDAWCYNFSADKLWTVIEKASIAYNRYAGKRVAGGTDAREFNWCEKTRRGAEAGKNYEATRLNIRRALYRPFTPCWLYLDGFLNWSGYKTRNIFPSAAAKNTVITLSSLGSRGDFSAFMTEQVPSYHLADTFNGTQCFPMFIYDAGPKTPTSKTDVSDGLFPSIDRSIDALTRRDGITDQALKHFRDAYVDEFISKEDVFYYTYGLLHSPSYRDLYGDTLRKELPRIPLMGTTEAYRAVMQAGRALATIHLGFEDQEDWLGVQITRSPGFNKLDSATAYRVTQMKFAGKRPKLDRSTIVYNSAINITGVPLEAYEYIVNGKSAIEWVMERQCVSTDKASGIVNDANDYAIEAKENSEYPLKLLMSVITVSMRTLEIVRSLPKLE